MAEVTTAQPPTDLLSTTLTIRPASTSDLPALLTLWTATSTWLHSRGLDQWQFPARERSMENDIATRSCWVVTTDLTPSLPSAASSDPSPTNLLLASITLDFRCPDEIWLPTWDRAVYVRRLLVHPDQRGRGLGAAMLGWASVRAAALGKGYVRLVAWTGNRRLREYYLEQRFVLAKEVEGRAAGAYYERTVDGEVGLERALGGLMLVERCGAADGCIPCAIRRLQEDLAVQQPERVV